MEDILQASSMMLLMEREAFDPAVGRLTAANLHKVSSGSLIQPSFNPLSRLGDDLLSPR